MLKNLQGLKVKPAVLVAILMAGMGTMAVLLTYAATSFTVAETESGTVSSPAAVVSDSSASGGRAIRFGAAASTSPIPAQVLNLTNWKITLPLPGSSSTSPLEVKQPQLATYYSDPYFLAVNTAAGRGVQFRANVEGTTTSGSSYPRSELREITSNGTAQASWSTTSGTHTMTVREAVTHLPVVKPQTVGAQIHDASNDIIEILADGLKTNADGTIGLCVRYNGSEQSTCLDNNYRLGTPYDLVIAAFGGHITIKYNGTQKFDFANSTSGDYFKAGNYTQSNLSKGDKAGAYGEVIIYALNVAHS